MAYVSDILYIFGNFICFYELLHFVMQSAIFNVLQANLLAKERLINQHAPTQVFRSRALEMNFSLCQRWMYSDRSNTE